MYPKFAWGRRNKTHQTHQTHQELQCMGIHYVKQFLLIINILNMNQYKVFNNYFK
jgi:hypothetical protein